MAYSIERMPERISIGRETETGVTDVMIDCGAWIRKWPGMALHAIYTPEGGAPYILQTETDGGVLVWHVTDADTATPGTGLVEIVGETDGRRKVSATVKVYVAARMSGTVGEPPEAAKPWADRVVEAAGRITGMQVQAETLDAGSSATAAWDGEQGLLTIGVPKGKDGKDAVVDATLTQSGQAADAKATGEAIGQLKSEKLTEPAAGLAVGKYFRVAALDENGHAVLEAVDAKTVGVQDVQVAGASVVSDGVANVPIANEFEKTGVVRLSPSGGVKWSTDISALAIDFATQREINDRASNNKPLIPYYLDYTVKAAMCDGKGAAWTSAEQKAARERMGLDKPYELIEEIVLEEGVKTISRSPFSYQYTSVLGCVTLPVIDSDFNFCMEAYLDTNISNVVGNRYGSPDGLVDIRFEETVKNGVLTGTSQGRVRGWGSGTLYGINNAASLFFCEAIIGVRFYTPDSGKNIPAGTKIKIYGVRA